MLINLLAIVTVAEIMSAPIILSQYHKVLTNSFCLTIKINQDNK